LPIVLVECCTLRSTKAAADPPVASSVPRLFFFFFLFFFFLSSYTLPHAPQPSFFADFTDKQTGHNTGKLNCKKEVIT
jgi:hypothetical protein